MTPADFLWSEDIMGLRLVADGANQFKGISINLKSLAKSRKFENLTFQKNINW